MAIKIAWTTEGRVAGIPETEVLGRGAVEFGECVDGGEVSGLPVG